MPRRPEIGNVQLYPNRPLTSRDKGGYKLQFYCPIQQARVLPHVGAVRRNGF